MWKVGQKISTHQPQFNKYIIWKRSFDLFAKTYGKKEIKQNNKFKYNIILVGDE